MIEKNTFLCFSPIFKKNVMDTATVGQMYRKKSQAGRAYQLITLPSFVSSSATTVTESIDTIQEPTIVRIHSASWFT